MGKSGDLALEAVANPLRVIENEGGREKGRRGEIKSDACEFEDLQKLINSVLFYTPQTESFK